MIILIAVIIALILVIIGVYFLVRRKTISDALKEELKRDRKKRIRDQEVEEDEDEKDLKDISSILDNSNEIMKVEIDDEYEKETHPKEQKTITKTIIIKPSNKLSDTEAERIKLKIRRKHLFEEFKKEEEKQKVEEKKKKDQAESKIKTSLEKLRKISKKDTSIIELPNEPPPDKKTQAIENLKKIHR